MDFPFIKTENLVKLYLGGKIHKVYRKMFDEANKMAAIEARDFLDKGMLDLDGSYIPDNDIKFEPNKFFKELIDYKTDRVDHHMNKMYKLLMKEIETRSKK